MKTFACFFMVAAFATTLQCAMSTEEPEKVMGSDPVNFSHAQSEVEEEIVTGMFEKSALSPSPMHEERETGTGRDKGPSTSSTKFPETTMLDKYLINGTGMITSVPKRKSALRYWINMLGWLAAVLLAMGVMVCRPNILKQDDDYDRVANGSPPPVSQMFMTEMEDFVDRESLMDFQVEGEDAV